jgi:hypothetical protein
MTTSGPGSLTRAIWRKSSHSNPSGNNCVEVARNLPGIVVVRDSKDPNGGVLSLGPDEWKVFLEKLRTAGPSL